MSPELLIIVPTRGRPAAIARLVRAWQDTDAFDTAVLTFAIDVDDPAYGDYRGELDRCALSRSGTSQPPDLTVGQPKSLNDVISTSSLGVCDVAFATWMPMVDKLNATAAMMAGAFFAAGFAGDDHVPRTRGWARRYVQVLHSMGTGIVYGDDLIQGPTLPTQWAMTTDIVTVLGRMVPARVEHFWCDNAVLTLGLAGGCVRYLPEVVIEHMHPVADKAPWDDTYERLAGQDAQDRDEGAFMAWRDDGAMVADAAAVLALRGQVTPSTS